MRLAPYRDLGSRRLAAVALAALACLGALGPLADVEMPTEARVVHFTFFGWTGPGWFLVAAFACAFWAWSTAAARWRGALFVSAFGLAAVLAIAGAATLAGVASAEDGTPIATTLRWGAWTAAGAAVAAFGLALGGGDAVITRNRRSLPP
ncbi:MAG TPA: hypothetical protein VI997_08750 [Candidatus Thermoplasmatota archaeon]|nr:hypothetical protein [Candidatus Thermoplasmatota archaeon]